LALLVGRDDTAHLAPVSTIRDWSGESHPVIVLEDGHRYRDRHHGSLSRIGANWCGTQS
jgi:hypothetical protein